MKWAKSIIEGFKAAREFNQQISAVAALKIPFESLDYWHALFKELLSRNEYLALEWLQYACDAAVETPYPAREHLRRVEAMIAAQVGAGEKAPKPTETMAGEMWEKIGSRKR